MQIVDRLGKQKNTFKILFENNAESILLYNANMFSTLIAVGIIVIFIPILISPFSESKSRLIPIYLLSIVLLLLTFLIFQLKPLKKRPLFGVYLVFAIVFSLSIYLSVMNSQEQRATIILGLFCIFPMCIIDRPYRIKLFSIGLYLVHTFLAFMQKGRILGIDDAVNCFCFLTLGIVVGNRLIQIRVEAFESKRQLILDRETDDLTGLKNRRKLFQLISEFEAGDNNVPSGVIMMDIDNFKDYNDRFGHAAGDMLLHHFGKLLLRYEDMFKVQFFRYGGEEFTGFAWGYHLSELQSIVEALKVSVNGMTNCCQEVGVSIGITDCETKNFRNYEKYIELADKALYRAKAEGKNRVVCFDGSIDCDLSVIEKTFANNTRK